MYELVVVGVSAGGLDTLCTILSALPEDFRLPLVVVQHRSKDSDALCEMLQSCTPLRVTEVVDRAPIEPGGVYLAPADHHLLVEAGFFSLTLDPPQHNSRPSIDVAFESAAASYGQRVVGVVLTGANHDGSDGLRRIADRGGQAVVQDPATAEAATMPAAALQAVPEAKVVPLAEIAAYLGSLPAVQIAG